MTVVTQVSINKSNLIIKNGMIHPLREGEEVEVDQDQDQDQMSLLTEERISITSMAMATATAIPLNHREVKTVTLARTSVAIHPYPPT